MLHRIVIRPREPASGSGNAEAVPLSSGRRIPNSCCRARAVRSYPPESSMPTGRAPRWASQAETYAVPQSNSIVSCPATSGRMCSTASGIPSADPPASRDAPTPRSRLPSDPRRRACAPHDLVDRRLPTPHLARCQPGGISTCHAGGDACRALPASKDIRMDPPRHRKRFRQGKIHLGWPEWSIRVLSIT